MNLEGKRAIVTGGAVRLGRAIALALAEAGADIGLHYFQSEPDALATAESIRSRGRRAVTVQADLSHAAESAKKVVEETTAALGGAEILVNSAAIFDAAGLDEIDDAHWDRTMSINLQAPAFLCREFSRQVPRDGRGHIVNIVDWRAARTDTGHLVYTLSKAGLVSLTRNLAVALAPHIQVNAVAPGAILPPRGADEDYLERVAKQIPLERAGSPEEVTDAVLYLLRSDFVTGEVLDVSGGQGI